MKWQLDDGGRSESGFRGTARDCVVRSIAIATQTPYNEVYDAINEYAKLERNSKRKRRKSHARTGVYRNTYERYLKAIGWKWTATMKIGSGCKTHLTAKELPSGRLIVRVSGHMTAVVDGIIHDLYDCSRDGTRCVYGYFSKED